MSDLSRLVDLGCVIPCEPRAVAVRLPSGAGTIPATRVGTWTFTNSAAIVMGRDHRVKMISCVEELKMRPDGFPIL